MLQLVPNPSLNYRFDIPVGRVAEPRSSLHLALGHAIARVRAARGYSEAQFAARAGLRDVDIVAVEQGELPLPLLVLERLAGALGLRASELVRQAEQQQAEQQIE